MTIRLEKYLQDWEKSYIRDQDIQAFFFGQDSRRYDAVKYALRKEILIRIRRGLYYINLPTKKFIHDPFELAQAIYSPSYISLQSALSFHGWIPEAVYTTTSVASRRSKEFKTAIGYFSFAHTPLTFFYDEVNRVESGQVVFLIATPWKALADYIYVYKKNWRSLQELSLDLRIEIETLIEVDLSNLEVISKYYDSQRVQKVLNNLLRELNEFKNDS